MKILSICYSHEANASIMIDGKIIATCAEERLSKVKMEMGYPKLAIDFCLDFAKINSNDLDKIVIVSENDPPDQYIVNRISSFSVSDFVKEQTDYWYPKIYKNKNIKYIDVFKDKINFKHYDFSEIIENIEDTEQSIKKFRELRINTVCKHLNVDKSKISHIKHEHGHIYYALYGQPKLDDSLIITAEGMGDYSNNTVSIFRNNKLTELHSSKDNHLGHLYKFITLLLGMKPSQHEFKVMGLAPYANNYEIDKAYKVFKNIFKVDGIKVSQNKKPKDYYFWFRDQLSSCRFDGIAGALQKVTEEVLFEWVSNCIAKTKISNVLISGGVAQNIKAAKKISEIKDLKNIYIGPSSGDGSLSIGGCFYAHSKLKNENDNYSNITNIQNVYLGPQYSPEQINESIKKNNLSDFNIIPFDEDLLVDMLVNKKIIARFSDRMEFGQRALGNRSIIASPVDYEIVNKINSQIKFRDFWMPFTPTILKDYEEKYILNPKKLFSPFMTMAFDTTNYFRKHAPATIHPGDKSTRPQILEKSQNPKYYSLIKKFGDKQGIYTLLNTSMNLHGMPMVCSPDDAIFTLLNSKLDVLAFDNVLIVRK